MKTPFSTVFTGAITWTIAMLIPLILWYVESGEFKTVMFLLYPIVMSMLSRTGWFWVRPEIVAYSSIIAFLYGMVLNRSGNVRKSLDDPQSNKATSATALTSITVVFLACMVLLSIYYKPMYNPDNFG